MRIVYLGSPEAAVEPLYALHADSHEIVLVVSGADKRRGRGRALSPTPVKQAAIELGLDVTDDLGEVMSVEADLGVVVAYGRIIPPAMLAHLPMVNLHFSLLPRWRGAAPVERAILSGDTRTGVCVMDVAVGLDTGGVHDCEEVTIGASETADQLRSRLTSVGAELLVRTLRDGLGDATPQEESGVTYAEKIQSSDRRLDPTMSTDQFLRVVRIGGAWTTLNGKRLKVLAAERSSRFGEQQGGLAEAGLFADDTLLSTTDGTVELISVQPEGKAAMPARDWARGARPAGDRIGT